MIFVKSMTLAHESALNLARDEYGRDSWFDMEAPAVTLFLSGMAVSGVVLPSKVYFKKMRDQLEESDNNVVPKTSIPIGRSLKELFSEPIRMSKQEQDDFTPENIYLSKVIVMVGHQTLNLPFSSFRLEAVQGWAFGRFNL